MTTETETEIKDAGALKTQLKRLLNRAQVTEGEKREVLHALGTQPGGPTAGGAGMPGAKQTEEQAKAQREREDQQAKAQAAR